MEKQGVEVCGRGRLVVAEVMAGPEYVQVRVEDSRSEFWCHVSISREGLVAMLAAMDAEEAAEEQDLRHEAADAILGAEADTPYGWASTDV